MRRYPVEVRDGSAHVKALRRCRSLRFMPALWLDSTWSTRSGSASVHLPLFQRFDLNAARLGLLLPSSGGERNVTDTERERIEGAGWAERLGGQPLFESCRFQGRRLYHLAHKPDGGCVFLDDQGRCRLHPQTGFESKPLTCRLYPVRPDAGTQMVALTCGGIVPPLPATRADLSVASGGKSSDWWQRWASFRCGLPAPRHETLAVGAGVQSAGSIIRRTASEGAWTHRQRFLCGCRLLDLLYEVRAGQRAGRAVPELLALLTELVMVGVGDISPGKSGGCGARARGSFSGNGRSCNGCCRRTEDLPAGWLRRLGYRSCAIPQG